MTETEQLIARDLNHVWHPCAQMKDFERCPPLVVHQAKGSRLYTNKGVIIDAISSWWCKSLGHGHPKVIAAIQRQLQHFEQIIGANTCYPELVALAEKLTEITHKQHVFFASDGASAVEIAMKLVLHANQIKGQRHKNEFIALKNAYHGETLGTMSIGDLGLYKSPYPPISLPCHFIDGLPYVSGKSDPLWQDCGDYWTRIEKQLLALSDRACALVVEPLIQGAAGMLCYSQDFLKKLATFAKAKDIYLITDEIMTGIGRTGTWLAADQAGVEADLICLSKGLTSGTLPLSCVMIDNSLFKLFYGDRSEGRSFLHSNTFSGNPPAVAAALATLQCMQEENILEQVNSLSQTLLKHLGQVASLSGKLSGLRGLGAVVAADLDPIDGGCIGNLVYEEALERGALLRPIGRTLYWLPPLNTDAKTVEQLAEITLHSIESAYRKS